MSTTEKKSRILSTRIGEESKSLREEGSEPNILSRNTKFKGKFTVRARVGSFSEKNYSFSSEWWWWI